jgi:hypothetical protein
MVIKLAGVLDLEVMNHMRVDVIGSGVIANLMRLELM